MTKENPLSDLESSKKDNAESITIATEPLELQKVAETNPLTD
jgi:hypothetical protein